jgi:proteasome assembly chaperone (PAC2) family protein
VRYESHPTLREPVLVAAFHGWNDGGSAATLAASFLRSSLDATRFAVIDPEEYVDFQQIRPRVSLRDGMTREVSWPETEFFQAPLPGKDRDVVICIGAEPNLRWKTFTSEIASLARGVGIELAITLGGLLADTPHTRPVPVTGAAHDPELAKRLGLRRSRYEGPTGIVGVLHDVLSKDGLASASLWAAVPHYIAANANPPAALALVRHLEEMLDVTLDPSELEVASTAFVRQVQQVLESDEETAAYVRELESREWDDEEDEDLEIPTGDELAEELQRFLRERRGEQGDPPS